MPSQPHTTPAPTHPCPSTLLRPFPCVQVSYVLDTEDVMYRPRAPDAPARPAFDTPERQQRLAAYLEQRAAAMQPLSDRAVPVKS